MFLNFLKFYLFLFILTPLSLFSQNWINSAGGNFNDESYDVEVDAQGNIYTTGYVTGNSVFSSTLNLQTNGFSDIYVSKSDANGNALWSFYGIAEYDDRGMAVTTDVNDNIYLCGQFSDTLIFAGNQHNNTIYNAGLLVKLDPNGDWNKRLFRN
ncbi:MAG: hypothetical protein Kow0079_10620 [Vicingaceae bacterium]